MRKITYLFIIIGFLSSTAFAAGKEGKYSSATPLGLGIVPPVQFPPSNFDVKGLRLSLIYGVNRKVYGIDVGLIGNMTNQYSSGTAIAGIFNYNRGNSTIVGAQIAGLANINKEDGSVYGVQASLGANLSKFTDIHGAQIGLYNTARHVYGLQLGLVNRAANLHGLQIGLANFNDEGPFRVSPLINFGF